MPTPECPRCGAPHDLLHPDPLARCEFCGALLASSDLPPLPLVASIRVDEGAARGRVERELGADAATGRRVGSLQLVYYPFAVLPSSRKPYRPLAALPPAIADGWRPSGASLIRDIAQDQGERVLTPTEAEAVRLASAGVRGTRVPISLPLPTDGGPTIHYPFWRVPIADPRGDSAAWVDGIDGQVILPVDLEAPVARPSAGAGDAPALYRLSLWMVGAGAFAGFVLAFPYSLIPIAAIGAAVWRGWLRA